MPETSIDTAPTLVNGAAGPLLSEITLRLSPAIKCNDDEFFDFCQLNDEWQIERTAQGEMIIMPPTGGTTGNRNSSLNAQLYLWARREGTGRTFDSSTGFRLPNEADRAPDASWVLRARLAQLTAAQKQRFIPLCPDFVVELRSATDKLSKLQAKMEEYRDNGARLGWLIDPLTRQVHIYRPGQAVEIAENLNRIAGDPELPGFILELEEIWTPDI